MRFSEDTGRGLKNDPDCRAEAVDRLRTITRDTAVSLYEKD
jgi:hypothetical protein